MQFQDHYIQRYVSDYPDAFVPMEGADVDWDGFGKEKLSYSMGQGVANFGYASALSFVIFVMVAILSFISMKAGDKRD